MVGDAERLVAELDSALPVGVELGSPVDDGDDIARGVETLGPGWSLHVVLRDGEDELATVGMAIGMDTLTIVVTIDPAHQLGCDERLAAVVLVVVAMRVGGEAVGQIVVDTVDPVFRLQARRLGFDGALRAPLRRVAWHAVAAAAGPTVELGRSPAGEPSGPIRPPPLGLALAALLPQADVTRRPRRGSIRQITADAAAGQRGTGDFDIVDLGGRRSPLRLTVVDRPGVLVESVAMAVDTALAVGRAMGPVADHVRQLSFVRSSFEFRSGAAAGGARLSLGIIDLNAGFVTAEGLQQLRRQARSLPSRHRIGEGRPAPTPPGGFALDGVVAHECWHVLEAQFVSQRYPDTVRFRREIGEYFGVETLEHVTHGLGDRAPEVLQAASARLAAEVSAYATTNSLEATAEMFKLWWCTSGDPPPVVRFFDGLLRRYFDIDRAPLGDGARPDQ